MKTFWFLKNVFFLVTLVAGLSVVPAHAQGSGETLKVNVPFGFEVGTKHMEPGIYSVSSDMDQFVWIKGNSTAAVMLARGEQGKHETKLAKLVFDRYGEHYFLRQVWFNPETNTYLVCPESKGEKQAKSSELAQNSKSPSNVEVALLRLP